MIRHIDARNFGILYLKESLAIHEPTNKLIDKKCNQKINRKSSFEYTVYKFARPKYKLKLSKINPSKNSL